MAKAFKVWVMAGPKSRGAHVYEADALPAVGETILVRKTEIDRHGEPRIMETEPVQARVSRVRAGIITAAEIDAAA